jgi:hypothetical protein
MGKIILEFDSVEEAQAAQVAIDGYKWKLAMWDLDQQLRQTTKYAVSVIHKESEAPEFEQDIAEKYREIIRDIIEGYGLNLND